LASERILFALHGFALVLALTAALAWPRVGEAALLVPLVPGGSAQAYAWADAERAEYLAIDPSGARVIARVPSNDSLLRALASGILPVAAGARGCQTPIEGNLPQWKN
jgi:hypothetical protein